MHNRLSPKKNAFVYSIYTFLLDLDEVETLSKTLRFFSLEKWNLFSFYKKDHLNLGFESQKENILKYLSEFGMDKKVSKIYLVTNIRVLGYTFNPVCFYYCYDDSGEVICAIAEVHNTFGELKPFYFSKEDLTEGHFHKNYPKFFYVSPFQDLETEFEFRLYPPGEDLRIEIDDWKDGEKVFLSTYKGKKVPLSDSSLFMNFLRYPLITFYIIAMIHWQALKLYLKKIPFYKKIQNQELQRGVFHGKISN